MYLLIRGLLIFLKIPNFDLHSIMYLLILGGDPHNVSINSSIRRQTAQSLCIFTFHNVSINSAKSFVKSSYVLLFTFHNVSINSLGSILSSLLPTINLHSIMYLLILTNQCRARYKVSLFTFHNVSINSR